MPNFVKQLNVGDTVFIVESNNTRRSYEAVMTKKGRKLATFNKRWPDGSIGNVDLIVDMDARHSVVRSNYGSSHSVWPSQQHYKDNRKACAAQRVIGDVFRFSQKIYSMDQLQAVADILEIKLEDAK